MPLALHGQIEGGESVRWPAQTWYKLYDEATAVRAGHAAPWPMLLRAFDHAAHRV